MPEGTPASTLAGADLLGSLTPGLVSFRSDPTVVWDHFDVFSGTLAFDIGANGGIVAEKLAANFERVVAFEPAEESYEHLSSGAMPVNVVPDPRAVSSVSGALELEVREGAIGQGELVTGDSLLSAWGESIGTRSIEAVTLDELVDEYGVPDFVKIDVEGHEVDVVDGGTRLWIEHAPRLLIEVHSAANGERILEALGHYDWDRYDAPSYARDSYMQRNHYWIVSR